MDAWTLFLTRRLIWQDLCCKLRLGISRALFVMTCSVFSRLIGKLSSYFNTQVLFCAIELEFEMCKNVLPLVCVCVCVNLEFFWLRLVKFFFFFFKFSVVMSFLIWDCLELVGI